MLVGRFHKDSVNKNLKESPFTGKFLFNFILLTVSLVFIILSYVYPISSFMDFDRITMNLHYVPNIDSYSGLSIACAKSFECNNDSSKCSVISNFYKIEKRSIYLEFFSYVFLFFWVEKLVHSFLKSNFGFKFQNVSADKTTTEIGFASSPSFDFIIESVCESCGKKIVSNDQRISEGKLDYHYKCFILTK